jgi:hypothetical protein
MQSWWPPRRWRASTANGWAGALITGISFLLAAYVYRRNRQDKRIEQVFDPAATTAGLEAIAPHELRHTGASIAIQP